MTQPPTLEKVVAAYAARFAAESGVNLADLDRAHPLDRSVDKAANSAALALLGARAYAAPAGTWLTGLTQAIDEGTTGAALLLPPQLAADLSGLHRTAAEYTAAREHLNELAQARTLTQF